MKTRHTRVRIKLNDNCEQIEVAHNKNKKVYHILISSSSNSVSESTTPKIFQHETEKKRNKNSVEQYT